ncbi:hypothetical protein LLG95_03450 [bacterium]|nr:hypothetical protein [bacterium]
MARIVLAGVPYHVTHRGNQRCDNYWLGLNKIAEERIVDDTDTVIHRADSEAASTPTGNGWGIYSPNGGETLEYTTDAARGKVLHVAGTTSANGIIGDAYGSNFNPNGTEWGVQGRRQLGFWLKNDGRTTIQINVYCRTSAGLGLLVFLTNTGTDSNAGWGYIYHLANSDRFPTINDGNWHYIELDLGTYQTQFSGVADAVTHVDGMMFCIGATQIHVDDIIVSAGAVERSYALIPKSVINGYMGVQTGVCCSNNLSAWDRYYYHLSDLGSVMATTNLYGIIMGVYEPDYWGKYRFVNANKPDSMTITGRFEDSEAGIINYRYRWYDSSRGRWLLQEPLGWSENLYGYCGNDVANGFDYMGLAHVHNVDCDNLAFEPESSQGCYENFKIYKLPHHSGADVDVVYGSTSGIKIVDGCRGTCRKNSKGQSILTIKCGPISGLRQWFSGGYINPRDYGPVFPGPDWPRNDYHGMNGEKGCPRKCKE